MTAPMPFPISPVHVALFARALGDEPAAEELVRLASEPGGQSSESSNLVPPTFSEALQQFIPSYLFRPRPDAPWPPVRPDSAEAKTVLHAEQRYIYHRPVRLGETLFAVRSAGKTWTTTGTTRGTLIFREIVTTFRDDSDRLVTTAVAVEVEMERQ